VLFETERELSIEIIKINFIYNFLKTIKMINLSELMNSILADGVIDEAEVKQVSMKKILNHE